MTTTPQQYPIQAQIANRCPRCSEPLKSVFRPPDNTSRWLLAVIAAILTPFIVGIFLWIVYAVQVKNEKATTYWHCASCGYHREDRQAAPVDPRQVPTHPWPLWKKIALCVYILIIVGIIQWAMH